MNEKLRSQRVEAISQLMCDADGAPYIARGFIYNGRILGMQERSLGEADDPALRAIATLRGDSCVGAIGLDTSDFRELTKIERLIQRMKRRDKGESATDDDDPDDDGKKDGK